MDFIENINEELELRYEEIGEFGGATLTFIDINNIDSSNRLFEEEITRLVKLIKDVTLHPDLDIILDLEYYQFRYYSMKDGEKSIIIFKDLDWDKEYNIYSEDIHKIRFFLERLIEFKVIKV